MIRFKSEPYEHYKDTETKWLGSIPAHWAVKRVKEEFISLDYKRIPLSGEERQTMTDAIYDYYGASGIIDKVDNYLFDEPLILIGEDGANLLMRGSSLAFIARGKYWVNNHAHVLRPKKGNLEYLCYLLESFDYTVLISGSAQPKLTAGQLNNVLMMFPPLEEQYAIRDYLDAKTAQIDRKIELLEQKAEKYTDLKKSVINQTITHGLNKTVQMKDSRLKWVAQIPAHWEIKRAKDLFKKMSRSASETEGIVTAFRDGQVTLRENRRTSGFTNAIFEHGYQGIRTGDLVIHAMDGFAGAIGVSDSNGKSSPVYQAYTPVDSKRVHNPYYGLLVREMALSGFVSSLGKGIRERSSEFRHKEFAPLELPVPPFEEQKVIADYLKSKIVYIEKIIETINLEVEKLYELRKTLINDVVTGKIKVYEETIHE